MTDDTLQELMTRLATRIRDLPRDALSDDVRQRLGAVIAHLTPGADPR